MKNTSITIDQEYLQKILARLIAIPSVNPSLEKGGAGEGAIAAFLAQEMSRLGLAVQRFEPEPGRVTVLGGLAGQGGGRSLMWNGHSDTVGVAGVEAPFSAQVREGRMYGRGAQDMKGSLAAMLAGVKALVDARVHLDGDVLVAVVADEEYTSLGTSDLIEQLKVAGYHLDGAIVTEPTDLQVATAHRGYVWLEIETMGKAAHGSRWWEGVDANRMMGLVLGELGDLADVLVKRPAHPLVGPASLHTPLIQGGREMSIYADRCLLQVERRTIPGETPEGVEAEIQAILDRLVVANTNFEARLRRWFERPPLEARPNSTLLLKVSDSVNQITNQAVNPIGIPFWTDAALLAEAGVDTLLIGPSGGGLHTREEWVELGSCGELAAILAEAALRYCA